MVVLASNSIHLTSIALFIKHDNKLKENSNAMPQPQLNSSHQHSNHSIALGFDHHNYNQTRSSIIRFEWNGRLGVEFDHGQGAARPSLSVFQMKDMKDAMA
jgi:hypothetical protein